MNNVLFYIHVGIVNIRGRFADRANFPMLVKPCPVPNALLLEVLWSLEGGTVTGHNPGCYNSAYEAVTMS